MVRTALLQIFLAAPLILLLVPAALTGQNFALKENQPAREAVATEIRVWRVGSPFRRDIPDEAISPSLEQSAREMGYRLVVSAFAAAGFAQIFFDAFKRHQPPDVLAIENYGVITGVSTRGKSITGIASDPEVRGDLERVSESLDGLEARGMEFLVRTSPDYQAARAFALRGPDCDTRPGGAMLPAALRASAVRIATDYLKSDPALKRLEDPERLYTDVMMPSRRHLEAVKGCDYWGAGDLAFVRTVSSFSSPGGLGWVDALLVLRKRRSKWQSFVDTLLFFRKPRSQWRLLAASTDPVSNTRFVDEMPDLISVLSNPHKRGSAPSPAQLLKPPDGQFPKPGPGERFGAFSWRPSRSGTVVAEVAEFAYNGNDRLFAILFSGRPPATEELSAGMLWRYPGTWKWRIWSVSKTGAVSFSRARTFRQ